MQNIIRYLMIGIVLPTVIQFAVYFQFTSNYTQDLFSKEKFETFYNSRVYKSRLLGKDLQLWLYKKIETIDKIKAFSNNAYNTKRLKVLDENADAAFYLTYFLLSTFFLALTSIVMLLIFEDKQLFFRRNIYKEIAVCFFILLTSISQFVITPYDLPGYFFQSAGILFFIKYIKNNSLFSYILLSAFILIATLNRETSFLILSFMASVYYTLFGIKSNWIKKMILPVLCFAIPYFGLKLLATGNEFMNESKFDINTNLFNFYSLIGLCFTAFSVYLIVRISQSKKMAVSYLLFSLPYIITILVTGLLIEYRLWVPLIESAIIFSFMNAEALKDKKIFMKQRLQQVEI